MAVLIRVYNRTAGSVDFGDNRYWSVPANSYRDIPAPIVEGSTDIQAAFNANLVYYEQSDISDARKYDLGLINQFRLRPVKTKTQFAPPISPVENDRYLVPVGASGEWLGHGTEVAEWLNDAWSFVTPVSGNDLIVVDEDMLYEWNAGSNSWVKTGSGSYPQSLIYPGNPNGHVVGAVNDFCMDTVNRIQYKNVDGTNTGWRVD